MEINNQVGEELEARNKQAMNVVAKAEIPKQIFT